MEDFAAAVNQRSGLQSKIHVKIHVNTNFLT